MKILIVSATYPPAASATAGIIKRLVKCFNESGHQVDGLACKSTMNQKAVAKCNGSTVYYADYAMYDVRTRLSVRDIVFKVKNKIRARLNKHKKIYDETMVRCFLKAMKRIDMSAYDAVISVCAFYSAAEAVCRYKEKFGLKAKTVLYQVDPIVGNITHKDIPTSEQAEFEDRIFGMSDVIFTTPIIYADNSGVKHFGKMIPLEFPCIDVDVNKKPYEAKNSADELKFVFAGYIYPTIRNPKYMLELFSSLKNVNYKLYIIGGGMEDMLASYQNGALSGKLVCMGTQTAEVCDEWLEKADVLVNISNAVPNQVPSKVFQYIGYGKPILNIYKLENSPCLAYLEDYPLAVNVFEGDTITEDFVEEIYSKLKAVIGKRVSPKQIAERYEHCTPRYVAKKMLDALESTDGI